MIFKKYMTEAMLDEYLIEERKKFNEGVYGKEFSDIFKNAFPGNTNAVLLNVIPEQAEDIYRIFLSQKLIVDIEIPRNKSLQLPIIINHIEMQNYLENYRIRGIEKRYILKLIRTAKKEQTGKI